MAMMTAPADFIDHSDLARTAETGFARSIGSAVDRPEVAPSPAERAWGVLAHLSGVGAIVVGPLVIAKVVRSGYVRQQATAAANFQLAFLAVLAPVLLVGLMTFEVAALFAVPLVLAWLLTTVLAATAAAGGERYRYPVPVALLRP